MPKLIENVREKILEAAQKQLEDRGYTAMTIQSVAKACGVGVGTVYNYYCSKEDILTAYIGQDWMKCVEIINAVARYSPSYDAVIRCIYDQLLAFGEAHSHIFRDEAAAACIDGVLYRWMGALSAQICVPLRKYCKSDAEALIIAEALITWIRTGKTFDEIYRSITKLF